MRLDADVRGMTNANMTAAEAIATHAAIVAEYRAGKEKAFNSLVGKVMAASRGKANPGQVNAILKRKLA